MLGIDPALDAGEITRLENLRTDSEWTLEPYGLLELGAHRGGHADDDATADVTRVAADRFAKALEDGERAQDHLAGLGRRVELAHDADRSAGAPRGEELALEQKDVADPGGCQVESDGGADDAAPDDDDLGAAAHLDGAAVTSATSEARNRRMGSPWWIEPVASTRAQTRLQPGWRFSDTRVKSPPLKTGMMFVHGLVKRVT